MSSERVLLSKPAKLIDRFWTIDQCKRQLGYETRQTIYNLLAQGMPSLRMGKKRLFVPERVYEWILSQQPDMSPRRPGRPRKQ
jgi:hypothetical protein